MKVRPLILVMGTTASGKTRLALQLAQALNGEIICGDALQLWQGISILSAAPTLAEQTAIKHHLFGLYAPFQEEDGSKFVYEMKTVRDWYANVCNVLREIHPPSIPIMVGGTHYFFLFFLSQPGTKDLLCSIGLQPILLFCDAHAALTSHVATRVVSMIRQGLLNEVSLLLSNLEPNRVTRIVDGYVRDGVSDGILQAIGLREFVLAAQQSDAFRGLVKNGSLSKLDPLLVSTCADALFCSILKDTSARADGILRFADLLQIPMEAALQLGTVLLEVFDNTVAYAKQQRKWARKLERHGLSILHIDTSDWKEDNIMPLILDEVAKVSCYAKINYTFLPLGPQILYCDTCKVSITGEKVYQEHIRSRAHRRRLNNERKKSTCDGSHPWPG
ncbi:tRNA delta2-isopentenylpyrophosphate transferase [Giardia duodenalis]|uniref:tRNA delta2-isopentenylpyrophosphate transferase n=1 Tax=Giardia intestinalis (strain ATCC 50803 / WB clone C6) TaxID=184922 RepID=A8BFG1_GIAIC|nr:tRNA delta2-isopentenylpyrophosphate transferase [Giardia intestinalis]KAE8303443.1 tRNA delta2-isopentenylpyrophosphate transferase [Giardia intestinalis]|eukprot:XP_001707259.1 tRNA delta2-isopentenylpyrophosphate transferase [Giardia lamblia ATCC 50803]